MSLRLEGLTLACVLLNVGTLALADDRSYKAVDHWIDAKGANELRLHMSEVAAPSECDKPNLLLLHAWGVPSAKVFDLPDASLVSSLHGAGRTTWSLDLPGYGLSGRPEEMDRPASQSKPLLRASEVTKDIDRAVSYIQSVCPGKPVDVLGWSWGGVVAGMWASTQPVGLRRLILLDSMYGFNFPPFAKMFADPAQSDRINPNLPAYSVTAPSAIIDQWNGMLATTQVEADFLREPGVVPTVKQAFLSADPLGPSKATVRRPNGAIVDLFEIFSGRPIYDGTKITAPTLVIHGDADPFADPTLIPRLTGSCGRREVILGNGTHYLLFEKSRLALYTALQDFLAESDPQCGTGHRG